MIVVWREREEAMRSPATAYAATAVGSRAVAQFQGRRSAMRLAGWVASLAMTSLSHAFGSMRLSLAVYAARRTMPSGLVFPRIRCDRHLIGSA
jgi:hypothetical protein